MNETDRLLIVRAALMQTTNTPGWTYIKQMANNIVRQYTTNALDEKDRDTRADRAAAAAALRDGFNDFFSVIETAKSFGTNEEPEWFEKLSEFEELEHGR